MRGFKTGLEALGHNVLFTDVRKLSTAQYFDYVLSYDYGYLINENAFLSIQEILLINPNVKLIHYFADNPSLKYAHSGQCELREKFFEFCKLHKSNIELVFWDKKFINDFNGLKSSYFPICVDCSIYRDFGLEEKYDITFLGRPLGGERQKILSEIIKKFPKKLKIFSYPKHFENSIEGMKHFLNDKEMLILKEISNRQPVNRKLLTQFTGIPASTVTRVISKLSAEPLVLIVRQGAKKDGGYILTEKGNEFLMRQTLYK